MDKMIEEKRKLLARDVDRLVEHFDEFRIYTAKLFASNVCAYIYDGSIDIYFITSCLAYLYSDNTLDYRHFVNFKHIIDQAHNLHQIERAQAEKDVF